MKKIYISDIVNNLRVTRMEKLLFRSKFYEIAQVNDANYEFQKELLQSSGRF